MEIIEKLLLIIIITTLCLANISHSLKGVWFAVSGSPLAYSEEGVKRVVSKCNEIGIDTIYFSVWDQSRINFQPSQDFSQKYPYVQTNPKFLLDPLKILINQAHSRNIKIFAWLQYGFAVSYGDSSGGPILRAKPEWASLDQLGQLTTKNNFQWMNGFHPEVQNFMIDMMKSIIDVYPNLDGIQGDDRLPAMPSLAGYDEYTVNRYKNSHEGKEPPRNITDEEWVQWRCDILNKFAERIWIEIGKQRKIHIHMAPSSYPWAKYQYLQDWPIWVNSGWVQAIFPQIYRYNTNAYLSTLQDNLKYVNNEKKSIFYPGMLIGVGSNPTVNAPILEQSIQINRALNISGESFFYHESIFDTRVADIIRRY